MLVDETLTMNDDVLRRLKKVCDEYREAVDKPASWRLPYQTSVTTNTYERLEAEKMAEVMAVRVLRSTIVDIAMELTDDD